MFGVSNISHKYDCDCDCEDVDVDVNVDVDVDEGEYEYDELVGCQLGVVIVARWLCKQRTCWYMLQLSSNAISISE